MVRDKPVNFIEIWDETRKIVADIGNRGENRTAKGVTARGAIDEAKWRESGRQGYYTTNETLYIYTHMRFVWSYCWG